MAPTSDEVKVTLAYGVLKNRAAAADLVAELPAEVSHEDLLKAAKARVKELKSKRSNKNTLEVDDPALKRELVYAVRSLAFCGIPYDDPGKDVQEVQREIRMWQGEILATYSSKKKGVSVIHGSNDRRFFAWLCAQAIKQGSNRVVLPADLSVVLKQIGWSDGSGYTYFYDSFCRWREGSIKLEFIRRRDGKVVPVDLGGQTGIIKAWHLPKYQAAKSDTHTPWFLELSLDFYKALTDEPFPIPLEYLTPFLEAPMGWDFAVFLAVRVAACRSESRIPLYPLGRNPNPSMITLKDQLGSTDSNHARWVAKLKKFLTAIKKHWDVNAEIIDNRVLVIRPTPYMVPYTGVKEFLGAFTDDLPDATPRLFPTDEG